MNDWLLNGEPFTEIPDGIVSFVYLITNKTNGKRYIGKKGFHSVVTKPPLKGKTRKRKIKKESDWKKYYGSSDVLKTEVKELGEDNFTREILHLCKTKGMASYLEAKEQFLRDVLFSDDYYNLQIDVKLNANMFSSLEDEDE